MITEPLSLIATLLAILALLFVASEMPQFKRIFKFLPLLLLVYFVPMVLSNLGIIPFESPVYVAIKKWLLPASLVLLTIGVDLPEILRLGPKLLALFFSATLGVMIGGPIAFVLFAKWVPEHLRVDLWKGFAALTGSWIGGGANFVAVGQSVNASADIMSAMVIADVGIATLWMSALLVFASKERQMDAKLKVDRRALDLLIGHYEKLQSLVKKPSTFTDLLVILAVAFVPAALCTAIARQLPDVGTIINGFTWVVLLITTVSILLSFTPLRRLESKGASKIGSLFLYLLITSIGANGNLRNIVDLPVVVVAAALWMLIHVIIVMATRHWLKAPISYAAIGSYANIGGAASAPVVASAFHPSLSTVGVLLAMLGYVLGTYLGIVQAYILEALNGWLF